MLRYLSVSTDGKGLYEITGRVSALLKEIEEALCIVFLQHTSASLVIQENADPSAKRDLENWMDRFIPEDDPRFTHTAEGSDDMPAHLKASITNTSLTIPVADGRLVLGTWQGIYIWEHRDAPHERSIVVHILPVVRPE